MNVWEFSRKHLYPYKVKGNEITPKYCPYCKGGSHKDEYTFALNAEKKTFNCRRGSCSKQGNMFTLCSDFGEKYQNENFEILKSNKTYKKPKTEVKPITNTAENYLAQRKISKATLEAYKIGTDKCGNIIFPFYEGDELAFVKFRPSKKVEKGERKSWREEGTKPILFGMQLCEAEYPLIITEGEIDALSIHEAGFKNAVSVPSGSQDFSWIETCWEWLQQFEKIIICGDNDSAGKEMVKEIIKKLGSYKCSIVEIDKKDINEELYYNGKESVKQAINNAKDIPVFGLIDLADIVPLDVKNMPYITSGIQGIDELTGGSRLGEFSVWTGRRGEGKSTLLSQLFLNAVQNDTKVCVYSGEIKAQDFQYWVNLQAAGSKNVQKYFDDRRNKDVFYVAEGIREKIIEWYRGKFFLYDNTISGSKSEEASILKVFEYAVKKYDCKMFMVDNLMTARYEGNEKDWYLKQINFVRDLVEFANIYNVHVHLVAHPKKQNGNITNDDISGRAEITNLAHNVYAVERDDTQEASIIIDILKNRWEGAKGKIALMYCPASRRIYQKSVGSAKKYGWEGTETKIVNEFKLSDDCPF